MDWDLSERTPDAALNPPPADYESGLGFPYTSMDVYLGRSSGRLDAYRFW